MDQFGRGPHKSLPYLKGLFKSAGGGEAGSVAPLPIAKERARGMAEWMRGSWSEWSL